MAGSILVHHIGSLGDTIVTIPALRAIRAEWPGAEIVMLHNRQRETGQVGPVEVLDGTGLVDRYVTYRRHAGVATALELGRVWRAIRTARPDVVVYVGPTERSRRALARDRRFHAFAGARRTAGFIELSGDSAGLPLHEAGRKLARLAADGVASAHDPAHLQSPFLRPRAGLADAVLRSLRVPADVADRLVAIGPDSTTPAKRWSRAGFEAVGRGLVAEGWYPIAAGGASAVADLEGLVRTWGIGTAACALPVSEVAAALSVCRAYVGVDSGLAHLASAVGTQCVVIAGGFAAPGRWEPLGEGHRILRHAMPCEGCALTSCPVDGHPCMQRVLPGDVMTAVRDVLRAPVT